MPPVTASPWMGSSLPAPDPARFEMTLVELLRWLASEHAETPAIVSEAGTFSYQDFAGQVGALTQAIQEANAPAGPVALLLPAGMMYIAAWFACAAAGRLMLMVEAANPPARNAALFEAAGVALVLHDDAPAAREAAGARASLVVPPSLPPRPLGLGGLRIGEPAFLFTTSGTTGLPKLVVYSQLCLQSKVQCTALLAGINPGDKVLIAGTHANFGVLHHALVFLSCGCTLCLHDLRRGGLTGMMNAIIARDVTHLRFTPSLFRAVAALPGAPALFRQIRAIRFSGEPLLRADMALATRLCAPGCLIQNLYGSTESMIFFWSSAAETMPAQDVVPNGRIYPVADFMLLDDEGRPAAAGMEGELVISSRVHALGDWRDGRIDTSRFPPDPRGDGRRLYYTGDLARLLEDGTLMVLGRKDQLVKINGQRVSLLEIEAKLQAMPGCARAAVVPWQRAAGAIQLVAFIVPDGSAAPPARPEAWLAERLPRYMVPSRFETVAEMPLQPGGKIDGQTLLARLKEPDRPQTEAAGGSDAPLLLALAGLWAEILDCAAPSPAADFFALGGDSLKMMALLAAVEARFGKRLADDAVLRSPTLAGLARVIAGPDEVAPVADAAIHPARRADGKIFDARGKIELRLIRPAFGASRGAVIGMPNIAGHAAQSGVIAANALHDYDVWSFAVELEGLSLADEEVWFVCAREFAGQLMAKDSFRPRALFGYSVGGYAAWLVDHCLQVSGWPPVTVINFDAGPLHQAQPALREKVDALLTANLNLKPAQMLLLHRSRPRGITLPTDAAARWTACGVGYTALAFPTLDHLDLGLPLVSAAASVAISEFIETGRVSTDWRPQDTMFPTLGGELLGYLNASAPPSASALRPLVQGQPLPEDGTCRLALLYLLIASGEAALALAHAARMTAAQPYHRAATYAQVALLAETGLAERAMALAQDWCERQGEDRAMRDRAIRPAKTPAPWQTMKLLPLDSDPLLDYAIDLLSKHREITFWNRPWSKGR